MSELTLSAIYRYPIKSAGGQSLSVGKMDCFGLEDDRRWMLVDSEGLFVSQRTLPEMALLGVQSSKAGVELRFGGDVVELARPEQADAKSDSVRVTVWGDQLDAHLADDRINAWLSERLGQALRLVWCPPEARRRVDPNFARADELCAFVDGFPLLVVGQASLDALNARLPQAVPMNRFRPNLVIAGGEAHAEDRSQRLRIGNTELALVKPCSRCVIPSIDQATGKCDPHINRVLAAYRRRDGSIYFGMNALGASGAVFRVGDPVQFVG